MFRLRIDNRALRQLLRSQKYHLISLPRLVTFVIDEEDNGIFVINHVTI